MAPGAHFAALCAVKRGLAGYRFQAFLLRVLAEPELLRLRQLVTLFLHEKQIVAAGAQPLDGGLCLKIAAQACLPILNLGRDCYAGWMSVIVYPDEFRGAAHFVAGVS